MYVYIYLYIVIVKLLACCRYVSTSTVFFFFTLFKIKSKVINKQKKAMEAL